MKVGDRIRERRTELGWTQEELAKKMGYKSKSTINKIEMGINDINQSKIVKFANALMTTTDYLMDRGDEEDKMTHYLGTKLPILGRIPCGVPITVAEYIDADDYVEIEESLAKTGEYYAIRAKGDSMLPRIYNGDIMIIHQQTDVESGQVAIVRINGHEATCKKIKKYRDGIELIPLNPSYQPVFFSDEDIEKLPVDIMGRVIEVRSRL